MKISNNKTFSKILAKHLIKKLGMDAPNESQLSIFNQGLIPIMDQYIEKLKGSNLVNKDGDLDLNLFESKAKEFFTYIPAIKIPNGKLSLTIYEADVLSFIKDLKRQQIKDGFAANKAKETVETIEECQN